MLRRRIHISEIDHHSPCLDGWLVCKGGFEAGGATCLAVRSLYKKKPRPDSLFALFGVCMQCCCEGNTPVLLQLNQFLPHLAHGVPPVLHCAAEYAAQVFHRDAVKKLPTTLTMQAD